MPRLADLEHQQARIPDLVTIGTASLAYAPTIDAQRRSLQLQPFNGVGAGLAAAVGMPLDFGPKPGAGRFHAR